MRAPATAPIVSDLGWCSRDEFMQLFDFGLLGRTTTLMYTNRSCKLNYLDYMRRLGQAKYLSDGQKATIWVTRTGVYSVDG